MNFFEHLIQQLLPLRKARADREALRERNTALEQELALYKTWVPPGHYYSPLHDLRTIRSRESELFGLPPREFAGIDLNTAEQWRWLETIEAIYPNLPFKDEPQPGWRYHFGLIQYHYMDAITYWGMLNAIAPRRVIEIGVGHSSLLLLDARDHLFPGKLEAHFIDPFPDLLRELLPSAEIEKLELRIEPVQHVPMDFFDRLQTGDILFLDSSHVAKAGSDVNFLFFEILPRLKPGVFIQFHDIFYPFEYPKENIYYGIAWNELYLLRAFLQFNTAFEIILWPTYLLELDRARFERKLPLTLRNPGGSIWLRRKD
jgi:hypothetical protein